jgi:hypothetical protein
VDIVAGHPIVGPHYGRAITDLCPAWRRLLGHDAFIPIVFEELRGSDVRILGAGVTAFVSDDFMREVKTPPLPWIGPELARRVMQGDCPLLTDKEVQEANSGAGLNLVVWQTGMLPQDLKRPEVAREAMAAFIELQQGIPSQRVDRAARDCGTLAGSVQFGRPLTESGGRLLQQVSGE